MSDEYSGPHEDADDIGPMRPDAYHDKALELARELVDYCDKHQVPESEMEDEEIVCRALLAAESAAAQWEESRLQPQLDRIEELEAVVDAAEQYINTCNEKCEKEHWGMSHTADPKPLRTALANLTSDSTQEGATDE